MKRLCSFDVSHTQRNCCRRNNKPFVACTRHDSCVRVVPMRSFWRDGVLMRLLERCVCIAHLSLDALSITRSFIRIHFIHSFDFVHERSYFASLSHLTHSFTFAHSFTRDVATISHCARSRCRNARVQLCAAVAIRLLWPASLQTAHANIDRPLMPDYWAINGDRCFVMR